MHDDGGYAQALALLVAATFVAAFVLAFVRWLLMPVTWRDGEGPLIDEGERLATQWNWLRWLLDFLRGRFWRW